MPKPGPNDVIGYDEYCREPTCQWHVVAIRTTTGNSVPEPVRQCPQNHAAGVVALPIRGSLPLPEEAGPVHQVLVLPARPYGGFVLQLGDDDSSRIWEGGVPEPLVAKPATDPMHLGARYVAELQRDLIQLGYLSQARWTRPGGAYPHLAFGPGKFTMPVAAGVLALKSDLAKQNNDKEGGYGVPARELLQQRGDAATPEKSPLNPDVNAPFPIFFSPQLRNPRTVTVKWDSWDSFFKAEAKARNAWSGMKAHLVYPKPIKVSYSIPPDSATGPRDEKAVAVTSAEEELHALETASAELSTLRSSATAAPRKAAIERGLAGITKRQDVIRNTLTADVGALADNIHTAVGLLTKDCSNAVGLLQPMTTKSVVRRSPIDWQLQSDRIGAQNALLASIKANHQKLKETAHADANAPAGKLARIVALCDDIVATITSFPSLRALADAKLVEMGKDARAAKAELAALVDAVDNVDFDVAMQQYRTDLREFARVDPATAYCIKKMIAERKLNGRHAYVGPEENEIVEWEATVALPDGTKVTKKIGRTKLANDPPLCEALLRQAALEVLPHLKASFPNVAFKIFHAMLFNESGWVQYGGNFEGFSYITMGIDWANVATPEGTGLQLMVFDEFTTGVPRFAANRGWGLSQNSAGDSAHPDRSIGYVKRVPGGPSEDHSDTRTAFHYFNSLPRPISEEQTWPGTLVSPRGALAFTMNLMIQNFNITERKIPCSFPSTENRSFDCPACLARFVARDFIDTNRLKQLFPFEADIATRARAAFLTDKHPKDDAEKQKLLDSPECSKAVQDAFGAQDVADRDAAKADAEALLAKRQKNHEKDIPTIEDFMKTPEFQKMVDDKRMAAQKAFKAPPGTPAVLPTFPISAAITPTAFARIMGRHATSAMECVEQPCSWLASRGFYAGRSREGMTHVPEVVRDVLRLNPKRPT